MLYGLVLAGGASRRMGRDKALLTLNGRTLLENAAGLLRNICDEVFVSVRKATDHGERGRYNQIADANGGVGPADGIVSALAFQPEAAWLVVACDLPRLDLSSLQTLVEGRKPLMDATAYSNKDGLPEPLCAIYEPRSRTAMTAHLADEMRCPRKMLLNMNTHLLAPVADDALANANTPAQWQAIKGGR